jgi:hypothetical protein
MNEQDLVSRMRGTDSTEGLKALAEQLANECLDAPKAMVRVWAAGAKPESSKARYVVSELEELAMRPMLGQSDSGSVQWRYRFMEAVVDLQLTMRKAILVRLGGLLGDESALAAAVSRPAEPDAKPLRVCDEAYVWTRRLAPIEDPKAAGLSTESEFLALDRVGRSNEIRQWRRSRIREALLETEDEPDYG